MTCPTADEASNHANVTWIDEHGIEHRGVACWYPQMGGYVGLCILEPEGNGCFDVYVWHDGEFPFEDETISERKPILLHHCMASQFIEFGEFAQSVAEKE